ncbi:helix-turn-helix domain-containing protein [Lactobacillus reuteri]|uniref:phBC6A51 family helix-turn-helix protein n=1 Tax=Limosilactobacillus reuteri TaxID=1598 RepID=UPI00128E6F12|nr:phBC6A51 family helix-turn-helix protein [Limosilactobacillus reuteri]MQB58348.1 helix-turn-helix domain-containing protein [Limosilactobacillus reuteri]MQB82487.1 helix-turn-helix domain-containing protein [Limosilactobacillus reuteri]MQB84108.1 helix-turn-helix domain-containing protein [Limosilactobacillus reuteri]MQB88487.1 helix-turn-helix domain-containing protein [Limosilactobacillus reuteri]
MKKVDKIGQSGPFFKLDKRRRKAVKLLFEDELSDEEIAKAVQRRRSTLDNWKHDELFRAAQQQYNHLVVKKDFESKALRRLVKLLDARSEMVQLQAANSILKLSGMLSDNSTPELDQAKIRKANADARVAEARAKAMEDNGQDMETLLDKMLDTITKEDKKDES